MLTHLYRTVRWFSLFHFKTSSFLFSCISDDLWWPLVDWNSYLEPFKTKLLFLFVLSVALIVIIIQYFRVHLFNCSLIHRSNQPIRQQHVSSCSHVDAVTVNLLKFKMSFKMGRKAWALHGCWSDNFTASLGFSHLIKSGVYRGNKSGSSGQHQGRTARLL